MLTCIKVIFCKKIYKNECYWIILYIYFYLILVNEILFFCYRFVTYFSLKKIEVIMNSLSEDCLIQIFEYLPVAKRLEMETVCKRWNKALKLSWHDIKNVCIFRDLLTVDRRQYNPSLCHKILKRTQKTLKSLSINVSEVTYDISIYKKLKIQLQNVKSYRNFQILFMLYQRTVRKNVRMFW